MINGDIINYLVNLCSIDEINSLSILENIACARTELEHGFNDSFKIQIEALYTLSELETIVTRGGEDICLQLILFLAKRWDRIQACNMQYLHDFTNPANQVCIFIAQLLSNKYYLALLMPTLVNNDITYLTSGYDEELELKELILSDNNTALIHLGDVLSFAQIDGKLKHNSLFNGKQRFLSRAEKQRLLSRDMSVKDYYDSLLARRAYRFTGDTLGAALNRLVEGLEGGGVNQEGEEHNAGSSANIAIADFFDFFATFSEPVQQQIKDVRVINLYADENDMNEYISLGTLFSRLTHEKILDSVLDPDESTEEEIVIALDNTIATENMNQNFAPEYLEQRSVSSMDTQIEDLSANYCVELIAQDIEKILAEHDELFELSPQTDFVTQSLARLDENISTCLKQYQIAIVTVEKHCCYQSNEPDFNELVKELSNSPQFKLDSAQICLVVKDLFSKKFNGEECSYSDDFFNYLLNHYERSFLKTISPSLTMHETRYFNQMAALNINFERTNHHFIKPRKKREKEPEAIADEFDSTCKK